MEDSLRSWLRSSYDEIVDQDSSDDYTAADANQMLLTIGRFIFGMAHDGCWGTVLEEMTSHFGRDLTPFSQISSMFLVEACLICAVSSISADRTRFVQIIMRMEPDVKAHIMEALKNNLHHYFEPDQSSNEAEDGQCTIAAASDSSLGGPVPCDGRVECVDMSDIPDFEEDSTTSRRAQNYTGNITPSNICFHCADNESKRAILAKDVESILIREQRLEAKLRVEITAQTNKLIDAEIIIIEKDDKLSQKNCLLESALSSIQEYELKIRESSKIINELQLIQDEVDILKPKADRADASEQQMDKLRSRLDELKGWQKFFRSFMFILLECRCHSFLEDLMYQDHRFNICPSVCRNKTAAESGVCSAHNNSC